MVYILYDTTHKEIMSPLVYKHYENAAHGARGWSRPDKDDIVVLKISLTPVISEDNKIYSLQCC